MTVQDSPVTYPLTAPPSLFELSPDLRAMVAAGRPVAPLAMPDGSTGWVVAGHSELRQMLTDQRFSRSLAAERERGYPGLASLAADSMFSLDPPDHSRLRRLVAGAFTMRRVEQLRPVAARIAGELLDKMIAGPRPADLISAFSLPLPVRVICALLGVPPEDQDTFRTWSECILSSTEVPFEEVQAGIASLGEYFAGLIAARRAEPADDLMSALIAARDEDDRLSERELVSLCMGLLSAGHETTANQIVMSLLTLLVAWPDQLERLRADHSLIPSAVEELLRFVQSGNGTSPLCRVTSEEVQLGGVTIPAGAAVYPAFGAANRDRAEFTDPDTLDLGREARTHMSFSAGVHHCLGSQLARMELQEAYRAMLTRLPGLRLAVPVTELRRKTRVLLYSFQELPVTWD